MRFRVVILFRMESAFLALIVLKSVSETPNAVNLSYVRSRKVTMPTAGVTSRNQSMPNAMTTTSVRASIVRYTGTTTSLWATVEDALLQALDNVDCNNWDVKFHLTMNHYVAFR